MITDTRIEELRTQALFMAKHGLPSKKKAYADMAESLRELAQLRLLPMGSLLQHKGDGRWVVMTPDGEQSRVYR